MIAILLGVIFMSLSLLHFMWASGVNWGLDSSIPTDAEGNRVINPGKTDSLLVGVGLGLFSTLYFLTYLQITFLISEKIEQIVLWVIPGIFLLRAIGDFRYVGLMKKVKNSKFGKTDTRLIVPLCILIAVLGFFVAWSN